MKKLRVAVVMGGESSEREISLISGKNVVENLSRGKYEVEAIIVPEEIKKFDRDYDVVFIAMHGKGGEDGEIQRYLEGKGLKYTGSGVEASRIGMNKRKFRSLMEEKGILIARETDRVPCVVKPANGGSSVGITVVKKQEDLERAINLAEKYDEQIVVEEYIDGVEISVGVLGNKDPMALPVVEICPKNEFFDYEAKYKEGRCEEIIPARLSQKTTKEARELAVRVFRIVGCRGMARVDMIIKNDRIYILEINTIPGLTPQSLLPKEAEAMGISYPKLLEKIIELAII